MFEKLFARLHLFHGGAVVLDKDGTLLNGSVPIPGATELLSRLKADGTPFVILSNTGMASGADATRALSTLLGVELPDGCVCTARDHLEAMLLEADGFDRVIRLCDEGREERPSSSSCSIPEVDGAAAPRVCIALFSDGAIPDFCETASRVAAWVRHGAHLWCTSSDTSLGTLQSGGLRPGPGVFLYAVRSLVSDSSRIRVVGKGGNDDRGFADCAMRALRAQGYRGTNRRVMVVGDRFDTDVRIGRCYGWSTCLVESGCHTHDMHATLFPSDVADAVASSVRDLAETNLPPWCVGNMIGDLVREALRHRSPVAYGIADRITARVEVVTQCLDGVLCAKPRRIRSMPSGLSSLVDEEGTDH